MAEGSSVPEPPAAIGERMPQQRRQLKCQDMSLLLVTQDIREPTDWCIEEAHHTVIVHLAGNLKRMETVFSNGPSSAVLPSVGDIWVVPAGCRYAALAEGDRARFAEFSVPPHLLGGGDLSARVAHRDPFLHQASARADALAARSDDLARMALDALLVTLRFHFAEAYPGRAPTTAAAPARSRWQFSNRQRKQVLEHIDASLHEPMNVRGLATAAGIPEARLMAAFKASFGTTPWQYVLRARLAAARELLQNGRASITSIAAMTGFSSPSHFATAFGKHFGQSPREFRRHHPDDAMEAV